VPYLGRPLLRREDRRLLTGRGQFIADLELPRMLHAAFVRSPLAHARIRAVDLSAASAAPGVALALSGVELARELPPLPDTQLSVPSKWASRIDHEFHNPQQPGLVHDMLAKRSLSLSQGAATRPRTPLNWSNSTSTRCRPSSTLKSHSPPTRRWSMNICTPTCTAGSRLPKATPLQ